MVLSSEMTTEQLTVGHPSSELSFQVILGSVKLKLTMTCREVKNKQTKIFLEGIASELRDRTH